jgi:thioesterase domain-containing protein/aryl carrier-like protein
VHLKAGLPDYMVPAQWVLLQAMPLSPNGKLDRKALPLPDHAEDKKYEAPRTALERELASLWTQALKVERVGLDDDFFESGGHSILMLGLLEKIRQAFDTHLPLHEFMTHPTIRQLSHWLRSSGQQIPSALVRMAGDDPESPNLFCLPPAGGVVFAYYPLAYRLRRRYQTYGVLHRSIIEAGLRYRSWDAMVDGFLADILEQQPHGPYHFLGWSSGGLLAMAICNRLEARGESVQWLGLVDAALPVAFSGFYRTAEVIEQPAEDEDLAQLVAVIKGFFPEVGEDWIARHWADAKDQTPALRPVDHVLAQLAMDKDMPVDEFRQLYDVQKLAAEMAVGFDVFEQVTELQRQAQITPSQVKPHCWWSSTTFIDTHALIREFAARCTRSGVARAEVVDIEHSLMVRSEVFLASLESQG